MKIFEIKFTTGGKPHALRIEGAASLTEAVKTAEMTLKAFKADTNICGAFEVYGGVTR